MLLQKYKVQWLIFSYIELDENIGDIHAMIADKEIEIMQELSKKILQYSNQLTDTVSFLSELDWYLPKLNYLVVDDD